MRKVCITICAIALAGVIAAGTCLAYVPPIIHYQGKLTDSGGQPADGSYNLSFKLFDTLTGGSQVGSTVNLSAVPVTAGVFSVSLDFGAAAFDNSDRWLQITVDTQTLSPRTKITAVPYAIHAGSVPWEGVIGAPNGGGGPTGSAGGDLTGTYPNPELATKETSLAKVSGGVMTSVDGRIGIGTDSPTGLLEVAGGLGPLVLDQDQYLYSDVRETQSGIWQSFTAGQGGYLGKIGVFFDQSNFSGWSGTLEVYAGEGIGGALLHSQSASNSVYHMLVTLTTPIPITPGNQYTFQLIAAQGYTSRIHVLTEEYASEYGYSGGRCSTAELEDMTFQTYVQGATPALVVQDGTGNVGIGASTPATRLDIAGGDNWNLSDTEGDFRIGNDSYRLKIGVALGGGGAGSANIRAVGGMNMLGLGAGTSETIFIRNESVGIGITDPQTPLDVNGIILSRSGGFRFPDGTIQTTAAGGTSGWGLTGNAGTGPSNFLGTTDNVPLEFRVNNARALRFEPTSGTPNIIGGHSGNTVTSGALGATIGGGGLNVFANRVTDSYGVVSGGAGNQAGDNAGTNDDRMYATVGGGAYNVASGSASVIGGGWENYASGSYATVSGGYINRADGSGSFAAGKGSVAGHDGAFVWADWGGYGYFASTAANQFLIRASGGVGINTNTPGFPLTFANSLGDKISLWGQSGAHYGLGVQSGLLQIHSDTSTADIAFGFGSSSAFTERMRIKGNGNVGIGTTTPQQALSVNTSMNVDQANVNDGTVQPGITFGSSSGEGIASKRTAGGSQYGLDLYANSVRRLGITNTGRVEIASANHWDLTNTEGDLRIGNDTYRLKMGVALGGGGAGAAGIRAVGGINMLVLGSGSTETAFIVNNRLGVGTSGPTEKLHVMGNVKADAYLTNSDLRLKKNIEPLAGALESVSQINPVSFEWKRGDAHQIGFIAQELKEILPEIVHQGSDGLYAVDYAKLTPLLVAAIKEQQERMNKLEAEMVALKAQHQK